MTDTTTSVVRFTSQEVHLQDLMHSDQLPQPAAQEAHLWFITTTCPASEAWHTLTSCLSKHEAKQANKFVFEKDRLLFEAAHGVSSLLLARYLQEPVCDLFFTKNAYGKPRLVRQPGESRLQFNLSHSGQLAMCGISHSDIGVDVECMRSISDAASLSKRFFAPDEWQHIQSAPVEQRSQLFLMYWTKKEALIKATGKGLSVPLNSFSVSVSSTPAVTAGTTDHVTLSRSATHESLHFCSLDQQTWAVVSVPVAHGYTAAVAMSQSISQVRIFQICM